MLEPFLLEPILVPKPWGGNRLGGPDGEPIGERWQVADLPAEVAPELAETCTRIATGRATGQTLTELIAAEGSHLMGPIPATPDGRFPLLVKTLDPAQHLSVQVHPDAEFVSSHPDVRAKTESWYVIDAEPEAVIFLDVAPDVTEEDVVAAAGSARLVSLLNRLPTAPGDFHHLPAGIIHALGAGVMVAEVQTPSDSTFRMYDWAEEYGRESRTLHLDEAIESLRLRPHGAVNRRRLSMHGSRRLVDAESYWIVEHGAGPVTIEAAPGPRVVMAIEGTTVLGELALSAGQTGIVPADALDLHATTTGTCLEIGLVTPANISSP